MGKKKQSIIVDDVGKSEDTPTPSRDFDAEQKDAEVMKEAELKAHPPAEDEIPPADGDKLWRHLSPKKILEADIELLLRVGILFTALKGQGISKDLFDKLPKEVQSLFHDELLTNEEWEPSNNI